MLLSVFQFPYPAQRLVQDDAAGEMVFVKKFTVAGVVVLSVVLPTQRQRLQALMEHVGTVPAHTNTVNVVQLGVLSAADTLL